MFIRIVIFIVIVSVLMAIYSLKKQSSKVEIKKVKKHLSKGRVIFQSKD